MSLAWVIYYSNRNRAVHLIQGISPEYNIPDKKPKFIEISFEEKFPGILKISDSTTKVLKTKTYNESIIRAKKIAKYPVCCTIIGESGTGKENTAFSIHKNSSRSENNYSPINCASLSDNLLESRLFGYKKGAFTGAIDNKEGIFEAADGGTVFLDEIGDVSVQLQQSLLRVLQEGEILAIGSNKELDVDVRIIAATNKDLKQEVAEVRFREDLYYRLTETTIQLKPLREYNITEIKQFIDHFILQNSKKFQKRLMIKENAKQALAAYHFPSNIRELQSIRNSNQYIKE